jgi:hypothetical protein
MNNDKNMQRMLEKATDAGDVSPDELDPESASLRDAWLAFGQMLDTAQPDSNVPLLPEKAPIYASLLREEKRTRQSSAVLSWHVRAASLLAVSLLIAVATAWMLRSPGPQANPNAEPPKTASTDPVPAKQPHSRTLAKADGQQWDDSLDERVAQVGWQMLCIQQNQTLRTDAIGIVEYKLGQLSKAIQSDSPEN